MANGNRTAWWLSRFREPSSMAGVSGAIMAGTIVAADKTNPAAWGALFASLVAILAPEGGR